MAFSGSLSNIREIESRWNTQLDATLSLSIQTIFRMISGPTTAYILEHVATRIVTKGIVFSMRMSAILLAGP